MIDLVEAWLSVKHRTCWLLVWPWRSPQHVDAIPETIRGPGSAAENDPQDQARRPLEDLITYRAIEALIKHAHSFDV